MKKIFSLLLIFIFFSVESFAQENKGESTAQENIKDNKTEAEPFQKPGLDLDLTKKQINDKVNDLTAGAKTLANNLRVKSEKIKSLMFNDKEVKDINNAVNSFKNNQAYTPENQSVPESSVVVEEKQENIRAYIYLASILYVNPNNWTVWIGDKKITNKTNKKENEIYITSLNSNRASVLWSLSISKWKILFGVENDELVPPTNEQNQIETRFILRPNQTFILNYNKVFEGKITPDNKGGITAEKARPITTPAASEFIEAPQIMPETMEAPNIPQTPEVEQMPKVTNTSTIPLKDIQN